jgi:hypothetical protein
MAIRRHACDNRPAAFHDAELAVKLSIAIHTFEAEE